jgi:hypothetical protein
MPNRFALEGIAVTQAEATTLCVYHLRMAAALFEILPDDRNQALVNEIDRTCVEHETFANIAAKLWAAQMLKLFDDADKAGGQ